MRVEPLQRLGDADAEHRHQQHALGGAEVPAVDPGQQRPRARPTRRPSSGRPPSASWRRATHAEMRGWKHHEDHAQADQDGHDRRRRPPRAAPAAGRRRPPADQRRGRQPAVAAPAARPARGGPPSVPDSAPGHQPDVVGHVGGHRRYAEREQGRERDQRPRPHHVLMVPAPIPASRIEDHLPGWSRGRHGAGGALRVGAGCVGRRHQGRDGPVLAPLWRLRAPRRSRPRRRRCVPGSSASGPSRRPAMRLRAAHVDAHPGAADSCGMPWSWLTVEPRPSSALLISEGMTQTLLASPSAIFGIIWRYW